MISKELLSEVLGEDRATSCNKLEMEIGNNFLIVDDWIKINIYELAHKCKEWALSKEYVVSSHSKYKLDGYNCILYCNNGEIDEDFTSDTESVAIFKACQWILDNSKES